MCSIEGILGCKWGLLKVWMKARASKEKPVLRLIDLSPRAFCDKTSSWCMLFRHNMYKTLDHGFFLTRKSNLDSLLVSLTPDALGLNFREKAPELHVTETLCVRPPSNPPANYVQSYSHKIQIGNTSKQIRILKYISQHKHSKCIYSWQLSKIDNTINNENVFIEEFDIFSSSLPPRPEPTKENFESSAKIHF